MPGVSHSFTSRREQGGSEWPQKLSHCASENESVSVTPKAGRCWWRSWRGSERRRREGHTEKEAVARVAMESPAVMQRWNSGMSRQLRDSNLVYAPVTQKYYWRISSILDSQSCSLSSAHLNRMLNQTDRMVRVCLTGESEQVPQHKMSCLLHQQTLTFA